MTEEKVTAGDRGEQRPPQTTDAASPGEAHQGKKVGVIAVPFHPENSLSPRDVPVMVDSGLPFPREDGQILSSDCHLWAIIYIQTLPPLITSVYPEGPPPSNPNGNQLRSPPEAALDQLGLWCPHQSVVWFVLLGIAQLAWHTVDSTEVHELWTRTSRVQT